MTFRRSQVLARRTAEPSVVPPYFALVNGTVVITAITWTAYLVGVVYYQTFLDHLGVSPDLFPKQASDYFVFAFYACFSSVIAALSPIFSDVTVAGLIIAFWILITLLALSSVIVEKHRWVQIMLSKAKQRQFKLVSLSIMFPVLGSLLTFYSLLLVGLTMTMPLLLGQSAGAREASNYLKRIADGCASSANISSPCTEITEDGETIAFGIVLAASSTHVAVLEKSGSRSLILEGRELRKQRQQPKR